jgi:hypothetical protein
VSKLRLAFPSLIVSFVVGCAARDVPPVSAPPPASLALAVEPDEAPSLLPPDTDATEIAERWFHQSQGFNALEAYEIGGLNQKISFALARKWDGRRVKVLSYVTAPKELDELAYLILREPGRPADVFSYATPKIYDRGRIGAGPTPRTVFRVPRFGSGLGTGTASSIASEVVGPILPGDFTHARLPDAEIEGQSCFVIESRPVRSTRALSHLHLFISHDTGVALRTVYYRDDVRLRTVNVLPADVRQYDTRWLPMRRRVQTADGSEAELVLRNVVTDIPLDDQLFTHHNLRIQRLPKF